jgi:hypothetical protein
MDRSLDSTRAATGPAFTDAVTFSFGDQAAQLYGLARIGLSPGEDGVAGSALAVLFAGRDPVAAVARGGIGLGPDVGWEAVSVDGLSARVVEPLEQWSVALEGGSHGFELRFSAASEPAEVDGDVARQGGMAGYEQLCAVTGTVRVGGRVTEVRCRGQRGHLWGEPDWSRIAQTRTVSAWPEQGFALALSAVRPVGVDHGHEPVWAALLDRAGTLQVEQPRLSTTYDGEGRQRRAGLELWLDEKEGHPHRGSGEVLCGSTLDLGQLRLDCAFFRWRIDGRAGVGRYDVLRHADGTAAASR